MKRAVLALVFFLGLSSQAISSTTEVVKSLSKKDARISVAEVTGSILLTRTVDNGELRLVTVTNGGSTDVSPTEQMYLTFYQAGEMANLSTSFLLGPGWGVTGVKKLGTGIFEITFRVLDEKGDHSESLIINGNGVSADAAKARPSEFEDLYFESTITLTKSWEL